MTQSINWPDIALLPILEWLTASAGTAIPTIDPATHDEIAALPVGARRLDIIPALIGIEYEDEADAPSSRTIRIYNFWASTTGAVLVQGYCLWRKAPRSFRVDRIISIIDGDGEIHDDPSQWLLTVLSQHERQHSANPSSAETFINEHLPSLILYQSMANADDHICPAERSTIEDEVAKLILDWPVLLNDSDLRNIVGWTLRIRPTRDDVARAVQTLLASPRRLQEKTLNGLHNILQSDGILHESELEILRGLTSANRN